MMKNAPPTLRTWLEEAPFSLALSSGFFGFYAHTGMLCALSEAGFQPETLSGSSAGALVAGCFAAGLSGDEIAAILFGLTRTDFWDPTPGIGLLKGSKFQALLEKTLPVTDFSETRLPLSMSVWDMRHRRTRVIQHGALSTAIRASCALPGLFQPVAHPLGWFLDGGIADRPGVAGLRGKKRVLYHHLHENRARRQDIPLGPQNLLLGELPRVSPFRLEAGRDAFTAAFRRTQLALEEQISPPSR
jgi:NTE family protein